MITELETNAFARNEEFTLAQTVPLAKIRAYQIKILKSRAVRSSAKSASSSVDSSITVKLIQGKSYGRS